MGIKWQENRLGLFYHGMRDLKTVRTVMKTKENWRSGWMRLRIAGMWIMWDIG